MFRDFPQLRTVGSSGFRPVPDSLPGEALKRPHWQFLTWGGVALALAERNFKRYTYRDIDIATDVGSWICI